MTVQAVRQFESNLFGSLTVVVKPEDQSLWFIGRQVAEKLGYVRTNPDQNISDALRRHCTDAIQLKNLIENRLGLRANLKMISESDLYNMIISSTLPDAQYFREWVTREVLPSIREHGAYHGAQPTMAEQRQDAELFTRISEMFGSVATTLATIVESQARTTEAVATLTNTVAELVANQPAPSTVRQKPEGYLTRAEIRHSYGRRISQQAVDNILESLGWPFVEYDKYVEATSGYQAVKVYPTSCVIFGETLRIGSVLQRVIQEATPTSPTSGLYTHRYVSGQTFRIGN